MNVFDIILCAIGILLLLESFLAKTKDVPSTIIIKIIPFFCGAYCLGLQQDKWALENIIQGKKWSDTE